MPEKLIVIGGTAAGLSAASKAKRENPSLEIEVFEKSGYISYGACGLPYFIGGMIAEPDDLVSLTVDQMTNKRGVPTHIRHEVTKIDREAKKVTVVNLDSGEESVHPYDRLVIATGARPIKPDIPGVDADGVYYLRTVEDGIRLKEVVKGKNTDRNRSGEEPGDGEKSDTGKKADYGEKTNSGKKAAIVGGGFIGLEVAEEMTLSGVEVHVYELMPRLLPFLDESFSRMVFDELTANGVTVHTGVSVEEILTADGKVSGVKASNGETTDVDFVLMSIGVLPNSGLAKDAGLAIGIKGSIVVNDEMRTSDPSVYACGDCVQMKNRITGGACHVPLGTTANKQGRIAGGNIAGGHETFKGVLGSMVTKVFNLYIAATGLSEQQAKEAGYDVATSVVTKSDRASYYPGGRDTKICLVLDKKSGRLLGAQALGGETVAGRVNVFATAITCGMTVPEISELDLVYAPPVAPVYDPILIAASQAMKKIEK